MNKLHDLWTELRANSGVKPTKGTAMRLRTHAAGVRLFAGLDMKNGFPALVMEISENATPKDLARISSRTFDAYVGPLPGLAVGRSAVHLVLKSSEFEDLFSILGEDIVHAIEKSQGEAAAVKAVVRRIERWRKFVERNRGHLTEEEIRGLLGELVVLGRLIRHSDARTALDAWQGSGGLRDFELPEHAIEVKTHQAATGAAIRISDPAQLESAPGRPLYLTTLQLSRTENAGLTLCEAVNGLLDLLAEDVDSTEKLWDKLMGQGYHAAHADMYPQRYLVSPVQVFRVENGFPRITCNSVPAGVESVQFSIQLAAIQQFSIPVIPILGQESLLEKRS